MADTNLSRRSLLKHMPVAALATSVALPAVPAVDPIFAAIEKHRAMFKAYLEASAAEDDGKLSNAELQTAIGIENKARNALISTAATTTAGLLAAITWLGEYDQDCMPNTCGAWLEAFAKSEAFANLKAQGNRYV